MQAVVYVHGKGGSAGESAHYKPLFPEQEVVGLDYKTFTPWETGAEIHEAVVGLAREYDDIVLIANSIGAYFSMNASLNGLVRKAFFISPVVDMERLILDMLGWAKVSEAELAARGTIQTAFGEALSWDYLRYVRAHPIDWTVPTEILYGGRDHLTSIETIRRFAGRHHAGLTVMEDGEHWFHTEEQLRFLDGWLASKTQ